MDALKGLNLLLAFALELAMLAAFSYFGFQSTHVPMFRWLLAVALPLAVAAFWGAFLAPKAAHRLSVLPGMLVSHALFLLAALALYGSGQPILAVAIAVAAVIHGALASLWRQW